MFVKYQIIHLRVRNSTLIYLSIELSSLQSITLDRYTFQGDGESRKLTSTAAFTYQNTPSMKSIDCYFKSLPTNTNLHYITSHYNTPFVSFPFYSSGYGLQWPSSVPSHLFQSLNTSFNPLASVRFFRCLKL